MKLGRGTLKTNKRIHPQCPRPERCPKVSNLCNKEMLICLMPFTFCCCSICNPYLTPCNPMDHSMPDFPVLHYFPVCLNSCPSIVLVIPSNHLILCHSLLLLPSIFPSTRVFSNKSALCIRWSKHWNFSFSISPSTEYSGLISLRIDWFDLLAVQGTLKSLESINPSALKLLYGPTLTSIHDY